MFRRVGSAASVSGAMSFTPITASLGSLDIIKDLLAAFFRQYSYRNIVFLCDRDVSWIVALLAICNTAGVELQKTSGYRTRLLYFNSHDGPIPYDFLLTEAKRSARGDSLSRIRRYPPYALLIVFLFQ